MKLQLKKKRLVVTAKSAVHPDVVPDKQVVSTVDRVSTSAQTAVTRLTSLASQVVSSHTQTDSSVNIETQTISLLNENKTLQTSFSVTCSSVQTERIVRCEVQSSTDPILFIDQCTVTDQKHISVTCEIQCDLDQILFTDQCTMTDPKCNSATVGIQLEDDDVKEAHGFENETVSVRNYSAQFPITQTTKTTKNNSVNPVWCNSIFSSSRICKVCYSGLNIASFNSGKAKSCPMNLNEIPWRSDTGTQTVGLSILQPIAPFYLNFSPVLSTAVRSSPLATLLSPLGNLVAT